VNNEHDITCPDGGCGKYPHCPCGSMPSDNPPEVGRWGDKDDEWSARIAAAHPLQTGDAATYGVAMEMVGNRHSKGALVELVNWLLKGQP